jgi:argininosuccinate lyase
VRGKAGRVIGDLVALLTLVKGLPLAYNRDLQEDKASLFDAVDTTRDALGILAAVWRTLRFDAERFESGLVGDASLATDLADHLAASGVAFRDAHEVVARLVRRCEEQGRKLDQVTPAEAAELHPALASALAHARDPRGAAERRTSAGGTAWHEIERQVALLRELGQMPSSTR